MKKKDLGGIESRALSKSIDRSHRQNSLAAAILMVAMTARI